jgi:RNA polymerase sigma-70 factor (ECF subfamily)
VPNETGLDEIGNIVRRAQSGSLEDFQQLYDLFSRPIFNFILRLIGSVSEAEDLTQDTFLKVHSQLEKLRQPSQFRFWIYRIARNEVYQRLRQAKRTSLASLDDEEAGYHEFLSDDSASPNPERRLLSSEMGQVVGRTLQAMRPKYRDVFVLAVFEKISYQEISRIVGRSLLSVKTDIYRARLQVKQQLNKYLRENK